MKKYFIETFRTEKAMLDFINGIPIDDNFKVGIKTSLYNPDKFILIYKLK